MMTSILWIELVVGIIVSFTLLGIFIWGEKQGQFDDSKKMMNGLLNDSTEDLQDAFRKDETKFQDRLNNYKIIQSY